MHGEETHGVRFVPGEVIRIEREVTQDDLERTVELTGDRGRWHLDAEFARAAGFDGVFVPGLLTASLLTRFGGRIDFLARHMEFEFLAPVYPGDSIVAEIEVTAYDPARRFLAARFVVKNQAGVPVLRGRTDGFPQGPLPAATRAGAGDGSASYRKACDHDRRGEEQEAIPCYREALRLGLDPVSRAGAMLGLGSSLRNVGDFGESVEVLREAACEQPHDAALRSFLALSLASAGRRDEALVELFELVLRFAPLGGYARAMRTYVDEMKDRPGETAP